MTRGEEIHKAAEEFAFSDKTETLNFHNAINDFYYGAKWADEHPNLYNNEKYHTVKVSCLDELYRTAALHEEFLEKACEWLKEKLLCAEDYYPTIEFLSIIEYNSLKELINDFKKAMEE